jgi:preprotein translocase subunit YajC
MVLVNIAHAMGGLGGSGGQAGQGGFAAFVPIILMFVIFYFLLIRPQQKKAKDHQAMIANLKKGDNVVTSGGIYGQIIAIDESAATVEIADKVRVKVTRSSIAALTTKDAARQTKKSDKKT